MANERRLQDAMQESLEELRSTFWTEIVPQGMAAAVDDIRARVVEEGWFGKPMYDVGSAMRESLKLDELYGSSPQREYASEHDRDVELSDLYGAQVSDLRHDREDAAEL